MRRKNLKKRRIASIVSLFVERYKTAKKLVGNLIVSSERYCHISSSPSAFIGDLNQLSRDPRLKHTGMTYISMLRINSLYPVGWGVSAKPHSHAFAPTELALHQMLPVSLQARHLHPHHQRYQCIRLSKSYRV